jgi:large subunit ribosomal protein L29
MKASEIRDLSVDALQGKLNDAREELMKMRFQQATGELTDFTRLRAIRRDVARMLTILHEQTKTVEEGEK